MEYFKYLELIGGLILLIVSGDYLVKGGVSIAKRFHISSLVVGMTVVAFGTSAPELIVSLRAALTDNVEIALGNVIGSNIANIGLILGITALIVPMCVNRISLTTDWPAMMGASLLLVIVATDNTISRIEGVVGILLLVGFVVWSIRKSRKETASSQDDDNGKPAPLWLSLLFVVGASVGLAYGARFLVSGASLIAADMGISERVIGVTVVAFGTSVPELVASIIAAFKKEADISIGNIIGSNLFNILCVLGLTSAIQPIPIDFTLFRADLYWMLLFALLLFVFMFPWKKLIGRYNERKITAKSAGSYFDGGILARCGGFVLLVLYIYYVYKLF